MADTSYANCGDLSLAYQVFGNGPVELVFAWSFVSHIELFWTMPEVKALFERLGTFCRILFFDKAGVGLSDPVSRVRTLDERAAEIEAVMDAASFSRAVLFGLSEGGPAAIVFAATRPERTRALVLCSTYAAAFADWDDLDSGAARIRASLCDELDEKYVPPLEQIEHGLGFARAVRSSWGTGEALKFLLPSVRSMRQLGTLERMSASPGMAKATLMSACRVDVRPLLPAISLPTLVLHATKDPGCPVESGRYLADHIPGARLLEFGGDDHAPWFTDPDILVAEIEKVTGSHAAPAHSRRALRTVLFTDIVASTQRAAATGDERWRAVLQRFGEITGGLVEQFGGTVVKSTGDGHLMTFEGPTAAIRCAESLRACS